MAMSSRLLKTAAIAAVLVVVLDACSTMNKPIGAEDAALGETVKYNAAVQTVNPDPAYEAGDAQPGDSGAKAAAAAKRYRTDAVKPVESMATTSGSSGPR
jgi:hypothetical protein